jgi:hypothetical protein
MRPRGCSPAGRRRRCRVAGGPGSRGLAVAAADGRDQQAAPRGRRAAQLSPPCPADALAVHAPSRRAAAPTTTTEPTTRTGTHTTTPTAKPASPDANRLRPHPFLPVLAARSRQSALPGVVRARPRGPYVIHTIARLIRCDVIGVGRWNGGASRPVQQRAGRSAPPALAVAAGRFAIAPPLTRLSMPVNPPARPPRDSPKSE